MVSPMKLICKRCLNSNLKFLKRRLLSYPRGITQSLSVSGMVLLVAVNTRGSLVWVISPYIGNLSFLISLNLTDNSFGGTIPLEVGNLFRLQDLNMSFNFLVGGIPIGLYNCSRLLNLDLYSNHLGQDIPSNIGSLTKLITLDLGQNSMKGKFPKSFGNLTSLIYLNFGDNKIEGVVPDDIARLNRMVSFELSVNNFSGVFPPAIYNFSSLEYLYIFDNGFSGSLRPDFGYLLPNLRDLYMGKNYLTGAIPTTLSNISNLQVLTTEYNSLSGIIPPSFGELPNLRHLSLHHNFLGNYSFEDLKFLGALTNCTQLQVLVVGSNRLGGNLPSLIANLSTNLISLSLQTNLIFGSIPHNIGNLISLQRLQLGDNMLSGPLPTSFGRMSNLGVLSLHSNQMSGEIPFSIGNITGLQLLHLFNNSFEGIVPPSLGKCSHLLDLRIGNNKLTGAIPWEIFHISTLVNLSIANNSLTGSLPNDVGRLQNLVSLSLGDNNLSGQLPQTLGNCLSMERLNLQGNSFDGTIPNIKGLVGVKRVDLSKNKLSGNIPGYFTNFPSLEYLNLSNNNLEGTVPTDGNFQNSTIVLVSGNKNLCGGIKELNLKRCIAQAPPLETKHSSLLKEVLVGVSVGIALLLMVFTAVVCLCWFEKIKKNQHTSDPAPSTLVAFHEKISYGDLRNATNDFSSSNLIGSGSFGTVFKALLYAENKVIAVKVLNLQVRGAMKSFMAECKSLKDIKHRNLVKLLTACWSIDFKGNEFRALIYEFMSNGSLDMWLHPEEFEESRRPLRTLTLLERLNIATDVASLLDYLHFHCHEPITHCDIKPSNVLLDNDLTARVSDFGLAQILLKFDKESFLNQLSSTGVRGTIGYTAPEYGVGGQPSILGDVYSFGVLLLEMFTGEKPTSELFGGDFTIQSYTKSALRERVLDVVDQSMLHQSSLRVGFPVAECLILILEVGSKCCEVYPSNRLAASEAKNELISIREKFFKARRTTRL